MTGLLLGLISVIKVPWRGCEGFGSVVVEDAESSPMLYAKNVERVTEDINIHKSPAIFDRSIAKLSAFPVSEQVP